MSAQAAMVVEQSLELQRHPSMASASDFQRNSSPTYRSLWNHWHKIWRTPILWWVLPWEPPTHCSPPQSLPTVSGTYRSFVWSQAFDSPIHSCALSDRPNAAASSSSTASRTLGSRSSSSSSSHQPLRTVSSLSTLRFRIAQTTFSQCFRISDQSKRRV